MDFEIQTVRSQFPSLHPKHPDTPRVYFDNPAGTQVPRRVIDRMVNCLIETNANVGGFFETSKSVESLITETREALADFLNAKSTEEIIFGQNMTSLTFHLAHALEEHIRPGDEIVLTRMDHDANISPWLLLAKRNECHVRWLDFNPETYEYDLTSLDRIITNKTRLIAVNYASNLTGTINPVTTIREYAEQINAWLFVDAVQFAPHRLIDVQDLECDFLVCSAYKFFGPHLGVLWGNKDVIYNLRPDKVRPAPDELPQRFETGTLSHEGIAGTLGAIEYLASLGTMQGASLRRQAHESTRRTALRQAMLAVGSYEQQLVSYLIAGLKNLAGIKVHGITADRNIKNRVPTVAITHERKSPSEIAQQLAQHNIYVWSGHNYAIEATHRLGLANSGGVLRIGLVHYNTVQEIDKLLEILGEVVLT